MPKPYPNYRIRQRREALGLSLEEVAERLSKSWPRAWRKLNKSVLSMIETGHRPVYLHELPYFCRALECKCDELLPD